MAKRPKQRSKQSRPPPNEWSERLKSIHKQLHDAMAELVDKKDYSAAELLLRIVDKDILELIKEAGGFVVRSSD
jgi:hypothetical protein